MTDTPTTPVEFDADDIDAKIPGDDLHNIALQRKLLGVAEGRGSLEIARVQTRQRMAERQAAEDRLASIRAAQSATPMDSTIAAERLAKALDLSDLDELTRARINAITDPVVRCVEIGWARSERRS